MGLYLIFCLTTATVCEIMWIHPIIKKLNQLYSDGFISSKSGIGMYTGLFCVNLIFAPIMFLSLFKLNHNQELINGVVEHIAENFS